MMSHFHSFCLMVLLCLGSLSSFSAIPASALPAGSRIAGEPEGQRVRETEDYYRNGRLRYKTIGIYHGNGNEDRTITEAYRKDGTKKYTTITSGNELHQYTRYDKKGRMKYERSYHYSYAGHLQCVETRRANGERQTWAEPPTEESGYYLYRQ